MPKTDIIGPARNRVDGRLKVTGQAKYAVEFEVPNCAYAWPVTSNIARGKIRAIESKAARSAPGVLAILTHQNAPQPKETQGNEDEPGDGFRIEERNPLGDDRVHYAGQYVALVVAQTIEQAQYAASLVKVSYAPEEPLLTMAAAAEKAQKPKEWRFARLIWLVAPFLMIDFGMIFTFPFVFPNTTIDDTCTIFGTPTASAAESTRSVPLTMKVPFSVMSGSSPR